jgi:hypothetical protein
MNPRTSIFARLYGVAMVAHVVGNWGQPSIPHLTGWVNLAVGALGIWLSVRPDRLVMMLSAASVIASVAAEIPATGNHWVLAGLVGMVILLSGNSDRQLGAARWILLVFYAFAAFAKLNSGFFDPSVSCAVFYGNQSLDAVGLPSIDPSSALAHAAIWGTVAIECSIPLLLVWRRTRYVGVMLGTGFHTLLSIDLSQHFYDFTSILIALFFLFVPDPSVQVMAGASNRVSATTRRLVASWWSVIAACLVLVAVLPQTQMTAQILTTVPFAIWIPASVLWLGVLVWARSPAAAFSWRPGVLAGLVIGVTVLNGLSPYTEVKTAYSFNMYANLVTADGRSNHFFVRRTLPLRHDYSDPIEVVTSSDPGLQAYADEGYLIAQPQFRRYLATHPDTAVTFRVADTLVTLERASQSAIYSDPGPWWWRFVPLRAIDSRSPPRCQAAFLPAL